MKSIKNTTTNKLEIKNSKFITVLKQIDNTTNINKILEEIKEEYPKATHYCYGYITETTKKSSDDKEPSNTAGLPILNVLEKDNIINVIAIVVRYFGGIKLGASGLIRAYTKAVKEAINNSELVDLIPGHEVEITFSYNKQKEIDYLLKNYKIINKEYLENIIYNILIPKEDIKKLDNYNYKIKKDLLIEK